MNYKWPGNVRELSNVIERSLYSIEGKDDMICPEHLPLFFRNLTKDRDNESKVSLRKLKEFSEDDMIFPEHLPLFFRNLTKDRDNESNISLRKLNAFSEKEILLHALGKSGYNINMASELLGIHRTALYRKMKKYNLPNS